MTFRYHTHWQFVASSLIINNRRRWVAYSCLTTLGLLSAGGGIGWHEHTVVLRIVTETSTMTITCQLVKTKDESIYWNNKRHWRIVVSLKEIRVKYFATATVIGYSIKYIKYWTNHQHCKKDFMLMNFKLSMHLIYFYSSGLHDFDMMKNTEVDDFRLNMRLKSTKLQKKRNHEDWNVKALYLFPPDVESKVDLPEPLAREKRPQIFINMRFTHDLVSVLNRKKLQKESYIHFNEFTCDLENALNREKRPVFTNLRFYLSSITWVGIVIYLHIEGALYAEKSVPSWFLAVFDSKIDVCWNLQKSCQFLYTLSFSL